MLCLPPIPEGYSFVNECFSSWAPIRCLKEFAGTSFFERYEKRVLAVDESPRFFSGGESFTNDSSDPVAASASKKKKNFKENSSLDRNVRKAVDDELDLYKLLSCSEGAGGDEIKKCYKKMALIFHPDKKTAAEQKGSWPDPAKMNDEEIRLYFIKIQTAFEILSDENLRKQYDSSRPFDEALPTEKEMGPVTFFEICGAAFRKEAKWSAKKAVPDLGDAHTPIALVKSFYRFWADFESWRDFSNAGEMDLAEAGDREERRWMQKENWKVVSKLVKQERTRLHKFVIMAESK